MTVPDFSPNARVQKEILEEEVSLHTDQRKYFQRNTCSKEYTNTANLSGDLAIPFFLISTPTSKRLSSRIRWQVCAPYLLLQFLPEHSLSYSASEEPQNSLAPLKNLSQRIPPTIRNGHQQCPGTLHLIPKHIPKHTTGGTSFL